MKLVAATGNPKKLREIRRILDSLGVEVITPDEAGVVPDAVEDGDTFGANAAIKAWDIYHKSKLPAVADDSGLCVDALDGEPGVYSARYLGEDTPYSEKNASIIRELEGLPEEKRTARFTSAICCVIDENTVIEAEESCEGIIGYEASGNGGFGYDPIFYQDGKSFADLSDSEKDAVSHRGKALRAFAEKLGAYLGGGKA